MTPDIARWLVREDGREAVRAAADALRTGAGNLAVAEMLRARGLSHERRTAVIDVALASVDHGTDALMTFDALAQSSPADAAAWRARRFAGASRVVDLCTGAGMDARALAGVAPTTTVEIDQATAVLARHNLREVEAHVVVADALAAPVRGGFVHADPSRRRGGARHRGLDETAPRTDHLLARLREVGGACVLVAPGVNLADPALPSDAELEFIQRGRHLIECAVWMGELRAPGAYATATLLDRGVTLHRTSDPVRAVPCVDPRFIVEPRSALVRARLHEQLAAEFGGGPVARGRALLAATRQPPSSPWYRSWRTLATGAFKPSFLRTVPTLGGDRSIEVSLHGADVTVEEAFRRLGPGVRTGPGGVRLFVVGGPDVRCFVAEPVA